MSQPTVQQQRAIEASGAVLLAAGAGTGKTATLVQRCVRLVTEQRVGVDRLLVVTFTNAAAAEMKQRLGEALTAGAAARPDDAWLPQQLLLLEQAYVSTLHAFCLELVRAHYAELGVPPGIGVLDDSVTVPQARQAALELVGRAVAAGTPVQDLLEQYCGGRGERLAELIWDTHRFFMTQPRADVLLERERERLANPDAADWRAYRQEITTAWLAEAVPALHAGVEVALTHLRAHKSYGGKSETAKALRRLEALLPPFLERLVAQHATTEAAQQVHLLDDAVGLANPGLWVRGTGGARRSLAGFFEAARSLRSWHPVGDTDPLDAEWARVRGPMRQLLDLTQEFGRIFTEVKRALGGLDFADLEQLTLGLLLDARGRPTAIAREWQERLDHVFVDECQDINAAQDALLHALAREGARANLFMVGDVKQSIYRFRFAAPERFQGYAESWARPDAPHQQVLPLTENFRSREGLLVLINDLFGFLMAPRLGGVRYGRDEQLAFALPDQRRPLSLAPATEPAPTGVWPDPDCRVELHLLREASPPAGEEEAAPAGGEWDDLLSLERQARLVAARLGELRAGQHAVWDPAARAFRPLEWRDVGVLLRAVRGRASSFVREFRRCGIPLAVEQGDLLETAEATDLTALLRVLDNPQQDIPLYAVLRSPLVGWSLEDLVGLSARDGRARGWDRLVAAAGGSDALAVRAGAFLEQLARWRRFALMTSLTTVLETILTETRYEAWLFTLPDGPGRVAQVRRFLDLARRYDPLQRQGLARFLRFLDDQRAAGQELDPLPPRETDAVRLLSVHKSKGLEFPVVVLADLGAGFQATASRGSLLWSRRWGGAPQVVDLARHRRSDSLLLWQVKREEQAASLAEELRLFYVATTRARDTLLLVGTFHPESATVAERLALPPALGIPQARTVIEWILRWVGHRADWSVGQGEIFLPEGHPVARLRWRLHDRLPAAETDETDAASAAQPEPAVPTANLAAFNWRYPHAAATRTPAKTSASALRRLEAAVDEEAAMAWPSLPPLTPLGPLRSGGRPAATDLGSAHHLFLQHLDLARAGSEEELEAERERLLAAGVVKPEMASLLDLRAILAFWSSPLGTDVRRHRDQVRRELAFTAAFAPTELAVFAERFADAPAEDFVVVQGAVDLAVLLPEELWVVDFKTDHLTPATLPGRAREHERQLRLYMAALERIHQRTVTRACLHFLALRQSWEVSSAGSGTGVSRGRD